MGWFSRNRDEDFSGEVAWVTGASSGIGRALALELGGRGARVAVSARRKDRLADVVEQLAAVGSEGLAVPCDVTDERQVEAAVATIDGHWGRLDVAVANAGFGVTGRVEDLSADDWRRQFDTNVVGAAVTVRHTLPLLRRQRGRVVLVSSVLAFVPMPGSAAYVASKFAVRGLGLSLAIECAADGVTVTTIHPGLVESDIGKVNRDGHYDPSLVDDRPRQLFWPTYQAAEVMADAIHDRRREFVFTGHGRLAAALGQHAPGLVHLVGARFLATRGGREP